MRHSSNTNACPGQVRSSNRGFFFLLWNTIKRERCKKRKDKQTVLQLTWGPPVSP